MLLSLGSSRIKALQTQNKLEMNADIVGALERLDKSWRAFEHKGKPMTKDQVRRVLVYGIQKGYKDTGQLSDEEVDMVIGEVKSNI